MSLKITIRFSLIVLLIGTFLSCFGPGQSSYLSEENVEYKKEALTTSDNPCGNFENYITDPEFLDHTPLRIVRVNIHFMNNDEGTLTFSNHEEATKYAKNLIYVSNEKLKSNKKMFLPAGNDTPVLPTRYVYTLAGDPDKRGDNGVYIHYDSEISYFNNSRKSKGPSNLFSDAMYKKYGVRKDEVINVFMFEHHPDSVASPTYGADSEGVGMSKWAKVVHAYASNNELMNVNGKQLRKGPWWMAGLFNHEIGHSLGLAHTWSSNDGCEDTPKNPNCWNYTSSGPCKTDVSNNVMDYNNWKDSWTPCQISKVHYRMSIPNSNQRKNLSPIWCKYKSEKSIYIKNEIEWLGHKDLQGDIIIEEGGSLTLHCTLHMAEGARITVSSGGTLILNGAKITNHCGSKWKGIELIGKGAKQGRVIVYNEPVMENSQNEINFETTTKSN